MTIRGWRIVWNGDDGWYAYPAAAPDSDCIEFESRLAAVRFAARNPAPRGAGRRAED